MLLHTYGAAMDICASAGEVEQALTVAQWMAAAGMPLNKVCVCVWRREGVRSRWWHIGGVERYGQAPCGSGCATAPSGLKLYGDQRACLLWYG